MVERYGRPPFGTLLSANPNPSTLANFGSEGRWLDVHQTGNTREHYSYWWMTELYRAAPAKPALAGEPYYSGLHALGTTYALGRAGDTPEDDMYVRSGMYGSLLSGGYAGYIYGAEGIWQSAVEPGSRVFMWDAFKWSSADTVGHLKTFAFVRGDQYRGLVPCSDALVGGRQGPEMTYEGWAYAAGAPDGSWYLLYFEGNCVEPVRLRGFSGAVRFRPSWFDPRSGAWLAPGEPVEVGPDTMLPLPARPDERDWGLISKVYGLCGLRVGYGLCGSESFRTAVDQVRQPFFCNAAAQAAALEALNHADEVTKRIERNLAERMGLEDGLRELGIEPAASQANFVWFDLGEERVEADVMRGLAERGILVRAGTSLGREGALRVTVGTQAENERFLESLGALL